MRLKRWSQPIPVIFILFVGCLFIQGCPGKSVYVGQDAGGLPELVHVFNGQVMGFYTTSGGYGFGSKATSILTMAASGSIGTTQQMPLDPVKGLFFLGTVTCASNCNDLIYMTSYNPGFKFSNLSSSEFGLMANGNTIGIAVNDLSGTVYTADSINNRVLFLNEYSAGYASGFVSPIVVTGSSAVTYLASDNILNLVAVTDPVAGDLFVLNGKTGAQVTTSPALMTMVGGNCTSAAGLSYIVANSSTHEAYVLCLGSVTYINMAASQPTYGLGSLTGSNFSVANIATATDIAINTSSGNIAVSGGNYVTLLNGTSGALIKSLNLTSGDCGLASMDLEGITYDVNDSSYWVADATNNKVYELDAGTLNFENGACSKSSFSTPDVPTPKRISFY